MSEVSFSKFLWDKGAMETCYKLYTWINHTLLMLLLQIFWKMSQISDYFKDNRSVEDVRPLKSIVFLPLTKESKARRHIRSMSDVQNSTPYRTPFRSRQMSTHTLMYDSDTRARRIRPYNHRLHRQVDSSDSSDYEDAPRKLRCLEQNIIKQSDSMRIL